MFCWIIRSKYISINNKYTSKPTSCHALKSHKYRNLNRFQLKPNSFTILACVAGRRENLWAVTKAVYRFWYDLESVFIQMQTESLQLLTFPLTTITGISFICRWQSVIQSQRWLSCSITKMLIKITSKGSWYSTLSKVLQ